MRFNAYNKVEKYMKRLFAGFSAFIAAAVLSVNASAKDIAAAEYISGGNIVDIYVKAENSDDISCRIAGVECRAEYVGNVYADEDEYRTLFLIDSSGSMSEYKEKVYDLMLGCIDQKQDNEYFSIAQFSADNAPEYLCGFETKQYDLLKAADKLSYDFNDTHIYDNLLSAAEDLMSDDDDCYRRIVLISDGCENSADGVTIDDVIMQLEKMPVPVYTVSFENSGKTNLEEIKNTARLARASSAENIVIGGGTEAAEAVSVISQDAEKTLHFRVYPDKSLLDGSVKAVELNIGGDRVIADIRMSMAETGIDVSSDTEITETSADISQDTEYETDDDDEYEEDESDPVSLRTIIIIAASVVIAGAVVFIIVVLSKKTVSEHTDIPEKPADNGETMIVSSSRSGETEVLIRNSNSPKNAHAPVILLRDTAAPDRTFEISVVGKIVIGRSSEYSTVVIDYDKSISKSHCRVYAEDGGVFIEDLGSSNKTYLNDNVITSPQQLHTSDIIKLGRVSFSVTIK